MLPFFCIRSTKGSKQIKTDTSNLQVSLLGITKYGSHSSALRDLIHERQDRQQEMESGFFALHVFDNSLTTNIDLSERQSTKTTFSFSLNLRGSEGLSFMPLGKNTHIAIEGKWANPSFT